MTAERILPGTSTWDECYFEHAQRYQFFADYCKKKRVIDAACGVGYGSHLIAESGAVSVTGLDISPEAIRTARKEFAHPNVTFLEADLTSFSPDGAQFDVALSFETIEHLPRPAELVTAVKRLLRPGGHFICSSPNLLTHSGHPTQPTSNPHHLSETTFDEFRALIAAEFEICEAFQQDPDPLFAIAQRVDSLSLSLNRSKLLAVENFIRKIFGKESLRPKEMNSIIRSLRNRTTQIDPLDARDTDYQKTFILVARKTL